jgi:hypothetical protein
MKYTIPSSSPRCTNLVEIGMYLEDLPASVTMVKEQAAQSKQKNVESMRDNRMNLLPTTL